METAMFCPKCESASFSDRFCKRCGTKLVRGPMKPANNTVCPECKIGNILPADNFCGHCGKPVVRQILPAKQKKVLLAEVRAAVKEALAKEMKVEEALVSLNKYLKQDLGLDSLNVVAVLIAIEDKFSQRPRIFNSLIEDLVDPSDMTVREFSKKIANKLNG